MSCDWEGRLPQQHYRLGLGSRSAGTALGVSADSKLSMRQPCAPAVTMAKAILGCINQMTVSRLREGNMLFYWAYVRLHL